MPKPFRDQATSHFFSFLLRYSFFLLLAHQPLTALGATSHPFTIRLQEDADRSTLVQASTDLKAWTNIGTNAPGSSTFTDPESSNFPARFYRILDADDYLSGLINEVFIPGEGFNTLQFTSEGRPVMILWRGRELIYRAQSADGTWADEVICDCGSIYEPGDREEYRFQPPAVLLIDPFDNAHVIRASGRSLIHYVRNDEEKWVESETMNPESLDASISLMAASVSPSGALHVAVVSSSPSSMVYGTDLNGDWTWDRVAEIPGNPRGFLRQAYAPRFFSMAVDRSENAHIVFTPEFRSPRGPEGYRRPYSELGYASNQGGVWIVETIFRPSDDSGDAGAGASIALGPNNQPAVASWYNERADTGSSQESRLLFHVKDATGLWTSSVVAAAPDRYAAGDGPKGTGFAPYLRFDSDGQPLILFEDHAAQHFDTSGQNEYAGQIRLARWDETQWVFTTLFEQTNPLKSQILYPAFAVSENTISAMAVERTTEWTAPNFRSGTSEYRFRYIQTNR